MTREEAIANWQNGIDLVSKSITVDEPEPINPAKANTVACWNNWFTARKGNFTAGSSLLKSVYEQGPLNPPDYNAISQITEINAYWAYLTQYGIDFIDAHPEIFST